MANPESDLVTEPPNDKERPDLYAIGLYGLVAMGLIAILAMPILSVLQKEIPEGLVALGGVAIGAIANLFVRTVKA